LSAHELLTAVSAARPETPPQSLAFDRDPDVAPTVGLGRDGNVYVNPYTGAILGSPSPRTNQFFQSMTSWHRYLGATGEYRSLGRSATGASNFAFLMLGITGLYLWWPKQLTLRHLRPVLWFRRTSTGRARDFNWHNTFGFWSLPAIIVMTLSGVVMSYSWGNNLVYQLTGSPLPAGRGGGPGGPGGPGGRGGEAAIGGRGAGGGLEGRGGASAGVRDGAERPRGEQMPREGAPPAARAAGAEGAGQTMIIPGALDQIFARAEQQVPTWSQLSLRLPNREGAPVAFTITDGAQWNRFARSQLTLSGTTGEIVQWQPYDNQSLGQKVRGWLRFAHTGELGGLAGQVIAGLGCVGGVMLVYSGLSLAFRRLWNWSLWARLSAHRVSSLPSSVEPAGASATRETVME
jgi:uncharacterized iron-regulated membrane protein